ncbi:hypothetical protein DSCO28_65610 [Desulfosarcina ovata subsp. sediminis]|uniref:DUF4037 domain-containing protein n=1 Tax=Desulfosarcina ovata subsp. sediminis TaxID=885957 RepID=A0A5K8A0C4_9BACT|nr:DUF4037 domain-containing protein [Desulfosarcina ovata]BBO85995.1 hypothetical protein DSCO28_65610 [Desulfosarcina ovata subsp. sediminis]
MKGLELCDAYFQAYGLPMIENGFGELKGRIAAGLVGQGSDCFGFDDEISRDHDWGPGFCLWLDKSDYAAAGDRLRAAYEALPRRFREYTRIKSDWGSNRVGVMKINEFYETYIGRANAPEDPLTWLRIPEENLAACTNGRVFIDAYGQFSSIRKALLDYYPEDVRRKRIAGRLMSAAQSGQYNFARCVRRNTAFASRYALIHFCDDIIRLAFLLNRRYCPFYKWRQSAVRSLPRLGASTSESIQQLLRDMDTHQMESRIEQICSRFVSELRRQGLSDGTSGFLLDHGPIVQARILDERLRQLPVWYAGA